MSNTSEKNEQTSPLEGALRSHLEEYHNVDFKKQEEENKKCLQKDADFIKEQ